jgi:hypothetical protein
MKHIGLFLWSVLWVVLCLILWSVCGCVQVSITPRTEPIPVCLNLPAEAVPAAKKGIEWWREPVQYTCPGAVTVRYEPSADPLNCGTYQNGIVTWRCGPTRAIVAHEFGHALGFADSCDGVMRSEEPGILSRCNAGGTW